MGRVAGTVVSTNKDPLIDGMRFLLVEALDPRTMKGTNSFTVAIDAVGAGPDEVVFYVSGSSSRLTGVTQGRPSDATITAIVDNVSVDGQAVYQKG